MCYLAGVYNWAAIPGLYSHIQWANLYSLRARGTIIQTRNQHGTDLGRSESAVCVEVVWLVYPTNGADSMPVDDCNGRFCAAAPIREPVVKTQLQSDATNLPKLYSATGTTSCLLVM